MTKWHGCWIYRWVASRPICIARASSSLKLSRGVEWNQGTAEMACVEFEDLLLDYSELSDAERVRADGHVAGCAACREFLEVLQAVDTNLTAQYSHRGLDASFDHALKQRIRQEKQRIRQEIPAPRPSLVPELLDFIGWAGILA